MNHEWLTLRDRELTIAPLQVFQAISKVVVEAQSNGIIASPAPIVGRIHQEMGLGMTKLQNAMCLGGTATGESCNPVVVSLQTLGESCWLFNATCKDMMNI